MPQPLPSEGRILILGRLLPGAEVVEGRIRWIDAEDIEQGAIEGWVSFTTEIDGERHLVSVPDRVALLIDFGPV